MGSFRSQLEQHLEHQIYALSDEEDPAAIPEDTVFTRIMAIDSRKISDSTILFYNDDTVDSFDYQVFGSNKYVALNNSPFGVSNPEVDAPIISDPSWINILRDLTLTTDPLDPATHNQEFFRTMPARTAAVGWNYESFSNKWAWIQILARTAKSGGLNAKILHRGTNQGS